MIISVDTGNKQIKTKHEVFAAGITEDDVAPWAQGADFMRMNKKYYTLCSSRNSYMRDKTESERYYQLTMMAVVKELEYAQSEGKIRYDKDTVHSITLLVGLPPAHMSTLKTTSNGNSTLKNVFAAYFKRNGEVVTVTYHNRIWKFRIAKCCVFAQGFSAAITDFANIKAESRAVIIDIGGFTLDYMVMRRGVLDPEYTDSLEKGVIILYQKIKKSCNSRFGTLLEEDEIDEILSSAATDDISAMVHAITEQYIEEVLDSFREFGLDLKNTMVVFVGGGALLLKNAIVHTGFLNKYRFIEDIRANVVGYELLYRLLTQKTAK